MVLTAAEKQKRYRQKRDSEISRRSEYLQKSKLKYIEYKSAGKRRSILDMTPREQRYQRKTWKYQQKSYRQKLKDINNIINSPNSPEPEVIQVGPSRQKKLSTKKQKRQDAKCYRDNSDLKSKIKILEKKIYSYKKRWLRVKDVRTEKLPQTPRSKTNKLLRHFLNSKKTIKRTLIFHNTLLHEMKKQYKRGPHYVKKSLTQLIAGKLIQKYKLFSLAKESLGISNSHGKRQHRTSLTVRLDNKVQNFYERDDVSRITSGIKQTITRHKQKKQKRILTDDLRNLHKRFLQETEEVKLSYSSFCRRRPFWVVSPTELDRETCACKLHENMSLLVRRLKEKQILLTENLNDLVESIVCDTKNKLCMYNDCKICKNYSLIKNTSYNQNETTKWTQWRSKKETRDVKNVSKGITVTAKEEIEGTMGDLVDKFENETVRFKRHIFNIVTQVNYFRNLKSSLLKNEVLLHIDFAENYLSKMSTEIHSMHFGASKSQITLHTGVYYLGDGQKPQAFCTVSDSLQHGPGAIWAYLNPVIDDIQKDHPEIDTIHFFSDGPSTQYKQKNNFYLFTTEVANRGFKFAAWNFHEASHGKGAPDGVGAALKRAANTRVLHGRDIINAALFVSELNANDTTVKLYEVTSSDVLAKEKTIPALRTVPGTNKLHQIITKSRGVMLYRDVSCVCFEDKLHTDHELRKFVFPVETPESTSTNILSSVNSPGYQNRIESAERNHFFEACNTKLLLCKTFTSLNNICRDMETKQQKYLMDYKPFSLINTGLKVDVKSIDLCPDDVEQSTSLFPVLIKADGNCLPYTGSVIAFGNENHGTEIRVRIIVEQVVHQDLYLSQEYLERGLKNMLNNNIYSESQPKRSKTSKLYLPTAFAMYSDEYFPESHKLNKTMIKNIYEREVLKIIQPNSYMGIWQIFALSSILNRPIVSIYPKLGNINVRKDLHRMVQPRTLSNLNNPAFLMWTSTRSDMTQNHWVPNHFVAMLPIEIKLMTDTDLQMPAKVKQKDQNNQTNRQTEVPVDSDAGIEKNKSVELKVKLQKCRMKKIEKDTAKKRNIPEDFVQTLEVDQPTITQSSFTTENQSTVTQTTQEGQETKLDHVEHPNTNINDIFNLPCPDELLGKLVIVLYNNTPYPGLVIDTSNELSEVHVRCMHRKGRKTEKCVFFWPRSLNDECWYNMDDVIAVIPELIKEARHFVVQDDIWRQILQRLN